MIFFASRTRLFYSSKTGKHAKQKASKQTKQEMRPATKSPTTLSSCLEFTTVRLAALEVVLDFRLIRIFIVAIAPTDTCI